MLAFQEEPDSIFRAILHEALEYALDVHLVCYREGYRPTRKEHQELDETYRDLFPELAPYFSRRRLIMVIERLLRASRDERQLYSLTDYHWLVLYWCLQMYCDLHNDDATGTGDKVGPYEIERIDFDAIVDQFFFDTDFLMGSLLLEAEEKIPGQAGATHEAWKIAAGLKPNAKDLQLVRAAGGVNPGMQAPLLRATPRAGYVGPYPLREPNEGQTE